MRLSALLLCVVAVSCGPVAAERYFVDQHFGSDDNDGTSPRESLASLSAAFSMGLGPGDSVFIADGDYRNETGGEPFEFFDLEGPIRISSFRGSCPLVPRLFFLNCKGVTISGLQFEFKPFEEIVPGWLPMPAIVGAGVMDRTLPWEERRDDAPAEFVDYFLLSESLRSVPRAPIGDQPQNPIENISAIEMDSCESFTIQRNDIKGFWAGIQPRHTEKTRIQFNAISECVYGVFAFGDEDDIALGDSQIRNNVITQCLDNGIDLRRNSNNVQVTGNEVSFTGRNHISLLGGITNCRVSNNRVHHGGYYSESMAFPGSSAISINDAGVGNRIIRNQASDQIDLTEIDGNGIILDLMRENESGSKATVVVTANWCYRNMGSGLNTTISPNAIIVNNSFIQNGWQGSGFRNGAGIKLSRDEDINQLIARNFFAFNRTAGIITNDNIAEQRFINFNRYLSLFAPLIWDGFERGQREYRSIFEVRLETRWESRGSAIGPIFR